VIEIHPNLKFHDGTPISSDIVAGALRAGLAARVIGPVAADLASIEPLSDNRVEIKLRDRSPFILEALEMQISKPGAQNIGTGPFLVADSETNTVLRANPDYFLGRPTIAEIAITGHRARGPWADLLRDQLDMRTRHWTRSTPSNLQPPWMCSPISGTISTSSS
jgi:MarR-like DNA-binding transcriptional regulator SgrR of sgrS sRNA